jgi:hypothetical protein
VLVTSLICDSPSFVEVGHFSGGKLRLESQERRSQGYCGSLEVQRHEVHNATRSLRLGINAMQSDVLREASNLAAIESSSVGENPNAYSASAKIPL